MGVGGLGFGGLVIKGLVVGGLGVVVELVNSPHSGLSRAMALRIVKSVGRSRGANGAHSLRELPR